MLRAKFEQPELSERLLGTSSAFLLEHNRWRGRDATWSDNWDGTGLNWLGLQLMLLRAEKQGRSRFNEWLSRQVEEDGRTARAS